MCRILHHDFCYATGNGLDYNKEDNKPNVRDSEISIRSQGDSIMLPKVQCHLMRTPQIAFELTRPRSGSRVN